MAYIAKLTNAGGVSTVTRYVDMLAGNAAFVSSSYESIATVTVGAGGASSISFTAIPATYQHLQLRFIGRVANSDTADNSWVQFNNDTGSNYSWHYLDADGSTFAASGATNNTRILCGRVAAATSGANVFGAGVVDILDYANTSKNKTIRDLTGIDRNTGGGYIRVDNGMWMNTSAITSIQITNGSATNFVQYTQFALYGIKG